MDDFDAWYEAERPRILATCLAVCGNRDAALDATDEAFTRALERWPRVGAMSSPAAWTQTVALNCLRRAFRLRRHRLPPAASSGREFGPELPDEELWSAVGRLPRRQQTAVVLRYVHDLQQDQVAQTMGISPGAAASTLAAARANLARLLADSDLERERVDGGSV